MPRRWLASSSHASPQHSVSPKNNEESDDEGYERSDRARDCTEESPDGRLDDVRTEVGEPKGEDPHRHPEPPSGAEEVMQQRCHVAHRISAKVVERTI